MKFLIVEIERLKRDATFPVPGPYLGGSMTQHFDGGSGLTEFQGNPRVLMYII